jgi:hypothetical protein
LADERRSRRFRDRGIDPLTFRVFLALIGTLFLTATGLVIARDVGSLEWWAWCIVGLVALLGASLLYVSLLSSDQNAEKWSDAASNHEIAALVFALAFPVAWAIRKVFPSDAT